MKREVKVRGESERKRDGGSKKIRVLNLKMRAKMWM